MHLPSLTELLEINNHKVTSFLYNDGRQIDLYLEMIDVDTPATCSSCGRVHSRTHDVETVTVEDLPILGKRAFLTFKKRKLKP